MSPSQKIRAAKHVQKVFSVSERRACKILNLARSTKRRKHKKENPLLIDKLHDLSYQFDTFGYRKVHVKLKKAGLSVGREKVRILRKQHGLALPMNKAHKRRVGTSVGVVNKADYHNHVWTYDFMSDQTEDGRKLRFLTVVDEFSRESKAIICARSLTSGSVIDILKVLTEIHGKPAFIRSDNGSEFVAKKVQEWLKDHKIKTHYISPGSPWENPYGEGFNAIFRYGCLDRYLFSTPQEAQRIADIWRDEYNNERPHGGLKMLTPAEFIEKHHQSML